MGQTYERDTFLLLACKPVSGYRIDSTLRNTRRVHTGEIAVIWVVDMYVL